MCSVSKLSFVVASVLLQLYLELLTMHLTKAREGGRGGGGGGGGRGREEREKERDRSNSKSLFYKDCSLGSIRDR